MMRGLEAVTTARAALTPDLGGPATTDECGAAVVAAIERVAADVGTQD